MSSKRQAEDEGRKKTRGVAHDGRSSHAKARCNAFESPRGVSGLALMGIQKGTDYGIREYVYKFDTSQC